MFHLVAHARETKPLFTDWSAGRALWDILSAVLHEPVAMLLMPDHVHLITRSDERAALIEAARAYSRWASWNRNQRGPLWEPVPEAEPLVDEQKRRRAIRYVHLNPCRAGLVDCPLAWPLSTYRDRMGLAFEPLVRKVNDPLRLHQWTSADGSTRVDGTPYPGSAERDERLDLQRLAGAVSEWLRLPLSAVAGHRNHRVRLLSAARTLTTWEHRIIALAFGVSRPAVTRAPPTSPEDARVLLRLAADRRAPGLADPDPRLTAWRSRRRA